MHRPTDTALRARARQLIEMMNERSRFIYAIPEDSAHHAKPLALSAGFVLDEEDEGAKVARLTSPAGGTLVIFASPELDVTFVEARGEGAPEALANILEKTEFYAQSALLAVALDVNDPEAPKALRTLAHMLVAWDEDWTDLFLLHLASPDAVVRHEAVAATTIAAMVAADIGPAKELLREAESREKFPKLKETIGEALRLLDAAVGGPVALD